MGISEGYGIGSLKPGVCTSSTRPASPFDGQVVYMTDVDQTAIWDGTAWIGLDPSRDRNVVINGAMRVAQRGTSTASITTAGYRTADRFQFEVYTQGTWTNSVENDAPTGSGFRKSFKVLCTTADASPAAGDAVLVTTQLEGQNVQQFAKGTASAKQFTLSFWVKSNVTGTYIAELVDNDNTRHTSISYTVSASATWEKKTIIFPADTTGAFDNDNGSSLSLGFWIGAGSNFTSGTLATTWAATTSANRAVGQTNLAAATSNYWQITGVQLEAGSVATPFEFEDYGTTLAKCQRYFTMFGGSSVYELFGLGWSHSTTRADLFIQFPVQLRATPTASVSSAANFQLSDAQTATACTSITFDANSVSINTSMNILVNVASGLTQYRPYRLEGANTSSGRLNFSAEL